MNYNVIFDFLIWYFIIFKVQLFKFSIKKRESFRILLKSMTEIINDKKYHATIKKFDKKLQNIQSKSELFQEIKSLRQEIEKDEQYFHFDFDIMINIINQKIKKKAKKEKRKITWKNPDLWGPFLWIYLHLWTLTCPKNKNISHSLKIIFENLPCKKCCHESKVYLKKNKINDMNQVDIYLVEFHNSVNRRLQKKCISCTNRQMIHDKIIKNFLLQQKKTKS